MLLVLVLVMCLSGCLYVSAFCLCVYDVLMCVCLCFRCMRVWFVVVFVALSIVVYCLCGIMCMSCLFDVLSCCIGHVMLSDVLSDVVCYMCLFCMPCYALRFVYAFVLSSFVCVYW